MLVIAPSMAPVGSPASWITPSTERDAVARPARGDGAADGRAGAHRDGLRSLRAEQGMAPREAAAVMLRQVAEGRLAVTSHPDRVRALADQRAERLRTLR